MSQRNTPERKKMLIDMIKNERYDELKNNLELVFARKMVDVVHKKQEHVIQKLKSQIKR